MKRWAYGVATLYVLILSALLVTLSSVASGQWPDINGLKDKSAFGPCAIYLTFLFRLSVRNAHGAGSHDGFPATYTPDHMAVNLCQRIHDGLPGVGRRSGALRPFPMGRHSGASCHRSFDVAALVGVFFRLSRKATPADLVSRLCRTLFKSSILELLIVVPAHIVASHRASFLSGTFTFIGLVMGVTAMLLSFGPAVLLLYAARWRRLHPAAVAHEMDPTPHLMSRKTASLTACGVLTCTLLALGLSVVVKPLPTEKEKSRQFTQKLNDQLNKDFEKQGWVSDGKGRWTSDTNTVQFYSNLNKTMEKDGWIYG